MIAAAWVISLPLAGACLAFLLGRLRAPAVGMAAALLTLVAVSTLSWQVWEQGPGRHPVGGWGAPLGIDLYADGLSALMLLMTATVGTCVSLYALGYFPGRPADGGWIERDGFWPLWLFLWAGLNALFLSADLFNLYVTLEVVSLSAVALVILAGGPVALTAGMRYLLAAVLGSLIYLLGVGLLYTVFGAVDIAALGARMSPSAASLAALTLMTLGLSLKTALFPLHFWLPPAHASAPAPVSAVLSALVVKASFYLLLRLWFQVFPNATTASAGQLLGCLGAAAIIWGSLQALRQERLKLLVAYSTVAQIGYLFLLVPLATDSFQGAAPGLAPWRLDAWSGGVFLVLSHAFAKAAVFLAAGTIMHVLGDDRIQSLNGLGGRLPITTFALGLAGLSIVGLPPSGGFVGKWLLLNAAIASGQWWWAVVIVVGTLLSVGYVSKVLRQVFLPATESRRLRPAPRVMELAVLALALGTLLLGLRATEPLALLQIGSPSLLPYDPRER